MLALRSYAGSASPTLEELSPTELGSDDVRIQVAAAAVNPVDVAIARGPLRSLLGLPDAIGMGWDVSGTITEIGPDVLGFAVGDRVAGGRDVIERKPMVGTHATETVLPAAAVAHVPDGVDLVAVAAVPMNALTALQALDLFGSPAGRTLLVTGGAGVVGGYALALARHAGWQVTALARSDDADFIARMGAELLTEMPSQSFDAVLDAAALVEPALAAVRDGGAFVTTAAGTPVQAERGITVQTVSVHPDGGALADILGLVVDGTIEVRVAGQVPLREAEKAYDAVERGGNRGRWLVVP